MLQPALQRLLTSKRVLELIPVSRTQLYRMINAGDFPKPTPIGRQRIGFIEAEVNAWIASRIRMRDEGIGEAARRERAMRGVGGRQ